MGSKLAGVKNLNLSWKRTLQFSVHLRRRSFIALVFCLLGGLPLSAQDLAARFYPVKSVYFLGEPVWFIFEVSNRASIRTYINYANPSGVCAFLGGYSFDVPGTLTVGRWRCGSYGGSCLGGGLKQLAPHAIYTQRLLLNQWFRIDHPGRYHVYASRDLHFGVRADEFSVQDPISRIFKSDIELNVVEGDMAQVEKAFEPVLKNLNSRDFDLHNEAIETIAAVAPSFLENTLITLALSGNSFDRSTSISALGRLNTVESRRALAKLIADRQPDYIWQAIDALAETGDRTYVPLLTELAKDPKWQNVAIPALGELGGEEVIPFLVPLIRYPLGPPNEPPVQQLAMQGLANTGSRKAIPILIQALRNPLVHQDAVNALERLTHLVIWEGNKQHWLYTDDDAIAAKMAERWDRWWKTTGMTAKLYGPADCAGSPGELPE